MHAWDFPQAGHDLFQMFKVGDVENDLHAGLAVGGMRPDVADVALRVADDAGDTAIGPSLSESPNSAATP